MDQQSLKHMNQIQHCPLQDSSFFQEYTGIAVPSFVFSLFQRSSSTSGYFLFVGIMGTFNTPLKLSQWKVHHPLLRLKTLLWGTHQMDVTSPREVQRSRTEPLFLIFLPHGSAGRIKALYSLVKDNHIPENWESFCSQEGGGSSQSHKAIPKTATPKFLLVLTGIFSCSHSPCIGLHLKSTPHIECGVKTRI